MHFVTYGTRQLDVPLQIKLKFIHAVQVSGSVAKWIKYWRLMSIMLGQSS